MTKTDTISKILNLTGKAGNLHYFEKLSDRADTYLKKLLKVVEKMAKK